MKKIVRDDVLVEKIIEAVNLLSDTVKVTLGPKGNNIIIDHSNFSPFITNDGVTIAQNIESDDEVINTILEIAKEASVQTNETVGDGTTTTLVLLQSILNLSYKAINKGQNAIILKSKLNEVLYMIIDKLSKYKIELNEEKIKNTLQVSSGDEKIAEVLSKICKFTKYKEAITVSEVNTNIIDYSYFKGYSLPVVLASPFFMNNKLSLEYKNALILIINNHLDNIELISDILNDVIKNKRCLIIVAHSYSEYFINNIVSMVMDNILECVLVKINEYGLRNALMQKDLEIICGIEAVTDINNITSINIGKVRNAFINKESIRFDFLLNKRIEKYINELKNEEKNTKDNYDKEFIRKRISMFLDGSVNITIGAPTKIELREKRMRLDDAICALFSLEEGILPGGGISLIKAMNDMDGNDVALMIWKNALMKPFEQILINSGVNCTDILKKIESSNYNLVYNVLSNKFEDISITSIVDPYKVVVNSLINACSIASMLITTSSIIINEHQNNLDKINDYGDI